MHCATTTTLLVLIPFFLGNHPATFKPDPTLDLIKKKMRQNLEKIPYYTCLQTIRRERFAPQSRKRKRKKTPADLVSAGGQAQVHLRESDTIRMEVAVVDGQELHSWPGAKEFVSTSVADMVGYGSLSSGEYAQHVRALFLTDAATFEFVGKERLQNRPTVRYDYHVPLAKSEYVVLSAHERAKVAHHGSLWADAQSADLLRLVLRASEIPESLKISEVTTEIVYTRASVGKSSVLLPQTAHLRILYPSGVENRNEIDYADCRQFGVESVLSFTDTPGPENLVQIIKEGAMPPGVPLHIRLETEIDSERSAVGDPIRGSLKRAVKKNGKVIVPKGALVTGRIRVLEYHTQPQEFYMIGLELLTVQFESTLKLLRARLEAAPQVAGHSPVRRRGYTGTFGDGNRLLFSDSRFPEGQLFRMQGHRFTIRPGLDMKWKTAR